MTLKESKIISLLLVGLMIFSAFAVINFAAAPASGTGILTVTIASNINPADAFQTIYFNASASFPAGDGTYGFYYKVLGSGGGMTMAQNTTSSTWETTFQGADTYLVKVVAVQTSDVASGWAEMNETVNPQLSATISASQGAIDYGQSITFNSAVSGGTPPYFYQWNVNGANVTGAINSTYTTSTLPVGTDTIKLWVSDSAGDPSNSKKNSSVPNIIMQDNIPVSSDGVYIGDPVIISIDRVGDILLNGNYSDFSFQWYGPGGPIAGATKWFLNVVEDTAGFYNFAVHIKILNSSLPYHGTWIGHYHLKVKDNTLSKGSVEFIETGLPNGTVWSAALYDTPALNGIATTGVDGFYITSQGNGLPTIIIHPPNGTYYFAIADYKWGQAWPGFYCWVSPGNYTPSITTGVITFPTNTTNGSIIIHVTFTPVGDPPTNDQSNLTNITAISTTSNNTITNSTVDNANSTTGVLEQNNTIITQTNNSTIPTVHGTILPKNNTSATPLIRTFHSFKITPTILNFILFIPIVFGLVIRRASHKKQREKEAMR
jgi:hypothetical protein